MKKYGVFAVKFVTKGSTSIGGFVSELLCYYDTKKEAKKRSKKLSYPSLVFVKKIYIISEDDIFTKKSETFKNGMK